MMKDAPSDILKKIHETERQADQIVREAEAQIRTIQAEAHHKAAEILKAKKQKLSTLHDELLNNELETIGEESKALLEKTRQQAKRLNQRVGPEIDHIVNQILNIVLPT